jgi:K+-sensing histidine kinase KdpD
VGLNLRYLSDGIFVVGDRNRITRVISNLLENAVKVYVRRSCIYCCCKKEKAEHVCIIQGWTMMLPDGCMELGQATV